MKTMVSCNDFPSDNDTYMNSDQLQYFRQKIVHQREELTRQFRTTLAELKSNERESDIIDRSDLETFRDMGLNVCRRYRELITRYEAALERIENGTFGYCEETGTEIGLKRLEVLPYATLCVSAQERLERGLN